jgi:hypothetical protein
MAGRPTSVSLDDLIAELEMYRAGLGGGAETLVLDGDTVDDCDIVDVFAERGRVYLQVRHRE